MPGSGLFFWTPLRSFRRRDSIWANGIPTSWRCRFTKCLDFRQELAHSLLAKRRWLFFPRYRLNEQRPLFVVIILFSFIFNYSFLFFFLFVDVNIFYSFVCFFFIHLPSFPHNLKKIPSKVILGRRTSRHGSSERKFPRTPFGSRRKIWSRNSQFPWNNGIKCISFGKWFVYIIVWNA